MALSLWVENFGLCEFKNHGSGLYSIIIIANFGSCANQQ